MNNKLILITIFLILFSGCSLRLKKPVWEDEKLNQKQESESPVMVNEKQVKEEPAEQPEKSEKDLENQPEAEIGGSEHPSSASEGIIQKSAPAVPAPKRSKPKKSTSETMIDQEDEENL